jgi:hypothetical protein
MQFVHPAVLRLPAGSRRNCQQHVGEHSAVVICSLHAPRRRAGTSATIAKVTPAELTEHTCKRDSKAHR